jgi:hypothetical protein
VQPGATELPVASDRHHARLSRGALATLQTLYQKLPESAARKSLKTLLDHQLAETRVEGEKG